MKKIHVFVSKIATMNDLLIKKPPKLVKSKLTFNVFVSKILVASLSINKFCNNECSHKIDMISC